MRRTTVAALFGMLALVAAGCGGDDDPPDPDPSPIEVSPPGGGAPPPVNGASPTPQSPAVFGEDGQTGTFACNEQNITINADDVDIHLVGPCGTVVVNGEEAVVEVDDAQMIVVNGEESRVTYGGDPEVTVTGEDATAEPAG